jgi:protein-S-isoprenylcysteine O-methyltransferase Ste14
MQRRFIDRLVALAKREYSARSRLAALAAEAVLFVGIIPLALLLLGPWIDGSLGLPRLVWGWITVVVGCLVVAAGCGLALWSIYLQFTLGRGTPVPAMATQRLVVRPPYTYCRNPMTLGTAMMYSGVAVLAGSIAALLLVLLSTVLLLTYVKTIEEKELEIRFGQEYEDYRQTTPLLLPRLRRRH